MTTETPLILQNGSYPASQTRRLIRAFQHIGAVEPSHLKVSQRGAGINMSVDVAPGLAVIASSEEARGWYMVEVTATENVSVAAAPAAGSERVDLIVAYVNDTEYGDPADELVLEAVLGTDAPVGFANPPSAPVGSIPLAEVKVGPAVAAIVDAKITDVRDFASPVNFTSRRSTSSGSGSIAITPAAQMSFNNGTQWVDVPRPSSFKVATSTIAHDLPASSTLTQQGSVLSATVPAGPVNVTATFAGDIYNATLTDVEGSLAVQISLDGGSTWSQGAEVGLTFKNVVGGATTDPEATITAIHARSGTSTGAIRARLMSRRTGSHSWRAGGGLVLTVLPG